MRRFGLCTIFSLIIATVTSSLWLSFLQAQNTTIPTPKYDRCGAIISLPQLNEKVIYLIFTADSMFEGGEYALDILNKRNIKASFFFTGNFLRDTLHNRQIIERVVNNGHYIGPHSNSHILLADWDENRTTLVTADSAISDILTNIAELSIYGIDTSKVKYIVPPYEWYNKSHIDAYRSVNLLPVNPSPGFLTYRDYTTPDMDDYYSSDTIWHNFMENIRNRDINGEIIILHLGTQDARTDKFYYRLPALLDTLISKGYTPTRL